MNSSYQITLSGERLEDPISGDRVCRFTNPLMLKKAAMMQSRKQNWTTPIWLYNQIKKERDITNNYDTDPATNESNPLGCEHYYTKKDNGLIKKWFGKVFINPPFTGKYNGKTQNLTSLWIKEAWNRTQTPNNPEVELVTMLIPARTDTKAFHRYIYHQRNVEFQFLKGRIKFGDSTTAAPFGSMVVDFYRDE